MLANLCSGGKYGKTCYKDGGTCDKCNTLKSDIDKGSDTFTQVKPVFKEPNYGGVSSSGALTPSGFDAGDTTHYKGVGVNSKSVKPHKGWVTDRGSSEGGRTHVVLLTDEELAELDLPEGRTLCRVCQTEIDKYPAGKPRRGAPRKYCCDECKAEAKKLQNLLSKDKCDSYRVELSHYFDVKDNLKRLNINFTGYPEDPTGQLIFRKSVYDCMTPSDFRTGDYNHKLGKVFEYILCRPIDSYNSSEKVVNDVWKVLENNIHPSGKWKSVYYKSVMARAGYDIDGIREKASFHDTPEVDDINLSRKEVGKILKSEKLDWTSVLDENDDIESSQEDYLDDDDDLADVYNAHYDRCYNESYGRYNTLREGYYSSG